MVIPIDNSDSDCGDFGLDNPRFVAGQNGDENLSMKFRTYGSHKRHIDEHSQNQFPKRSFAAGCWEWSVGQTHPLRKGSRLLTFCNSKVFS